MSDMVVCHTCGREIPISRSRLWWAKGDDGQWGTMRTCQVMAWCQARAKKQALQAREAKG